MLETQRWRVIVKINRDTLAEKSAIITLSHTKVFTVMAALESVCYLVYLGLDEEQFYERGCALDGGVDVVQG